MAKKKKEKRKEEIVYRTRGASKRGKGNIETAK